MICYINYVNFCELQIHVGHLLKYISLRILDSWAHYWYNRKARESLILLLKTKAEAPSLCFSGNDSWDEKI